MTCLHCGKPASGTLCAKCTADYWDMIRQLGHVQLPTLRSIMLRQAHIGPTALFTSLSTYIPIRRNNK